MQAVKQPITLESTKNASPFRRTMVDAFCSSSCFVILYILHKTQKQPPEAFHLKKVFLELL